MKCSLLFIVILTSNLAHCLKVLTTEPSLVLPHRLGQVELLNSSLVKQAELTICLRFLTFRFSTYGQPWYAQSVLTYGDKTILYAYVAEDCEAKFPGCTQRYQAWVENWAHGRPFGYFYESSKSNGYYQAWQPGVWNHCCITASDSQGLLEININGETHYRTKNYRKTFSKLEHNIVLMNDGGYWEGIPMHGSVTDVQVWSRVLSGEEMAGWYHCNTSITGDIIDWATVQWATLHLNTVEMDKTSICMRDAGDPVFKAFNTKKNFAETLHFCETIQGKIALAEDRQTYKAMNETFLEVCTTSKDFFTGFTDQRTDERWEDPNTGDQIIFSNWAEGFPTNYYGYDCSYSAAEYEMRDYVCSVRTCPICQVKPTDFILRGVCLESAADKFYFTEQFQYFLGYKTSRLMFSLARARWEIVNQTNTEQVLAFMASQPSLDGREGGDCPVGKNHWYFLDTNCTDPGQQFRSLNLHVNLAQPGYFCCDDGHCMDSRFVCNNLPDCSGQEDERNCSFLSFDKFGYDNNRPPIDYRNGEIKLTTLQATFTVVKILDVNEGDSTFELHFLLEVQWFDKNVRFEFLKDQDYDNALSPELIEKIWVPKIKFYDSITLINTYTWEVFVTKLVKPRLNGEVDTLNIREVYEGSENPFNILLEKRIKFTCLFDNIRFYPFGEQVCSLKFYLEGADSNLTNINPREILNKGQTEFGQYVIKSWTMEEEFNRRKNIKVSLVLSRKIRSIFMVTYLPTILMNLVNQATNYIKSEDHFSLVYTINITCMMVLASVYLSVSASLPTTSDIKPVEVWLLFNLGYPILVITSNIIQQALEKCLLDSQNTFLQPIKVKPQIGAEEAEFSKTKPSSVVLKIFEIFKITSLYLNPLFYVVFSLIYFIKYYL